jgi:hypothetical protein
MSYSYSFILNKLVEKSDTSGVIDIAYSLAFLKKACQEPIIKEDSNTAPYRMINYLKENHPELLL